MKTREKSLTLLEILVSLAIFGLVITGMINVFIASQRHMTHSRSRMGAGEVGKSFLDTLQADVNQSTWATNCVGNNVCGPQVWTDPSSNINYNAAIVSSAYTGTPPQPVNIRRVALNLQWIEPQ